MSISGWDICVRFAEKGLLAKPTHHYIIRLAPPLVITKEQIDDCVRIIKESFNEF
jgi:ornithine--oxo-acid transaminase